MTGLIQGAQRGWFHGGRWLVLPTAAVLLTAGSVAVRPQGIPTRVLGEQFNSSASTGNSGCGNGNSGSKDCTPPGKAIAVTGTVLGSVKPGSSTKLRLVIQNPNNQDLSVQSASGFVGLPSDPNCRADWFSVAPYAGTPVTTVKKNSSAILDLNFTMLDKPVNQDACKSATIPLSFTATATGA